MTEIRRLREYVETCFFLAEHISDKAVSKRLMELAAETRMQADKLEDEARRPPCGFVDDPTVSAAAPSEAAPISLKRAK